MDALGKRELIEFYELHIRRFGMSPEALRWTEKGQRARYEFILSILKRFKPRTVLDFGCGFGDLYRPIIELLPEVKYTGIDINHRVVEMAKLRYPEAEFLCMDIEETTFDRSFDITIACGVFNLKVAGLRESMKDVMKRLFQVTEEVLVMDFLTACSRHKDVQLNLIEPDELMGFVIKNLSPYAVLFHQIVEDALFLLVFKSRNLMKKMI